MVDYKISNSDPTNHNSDTQIGPCPHLVGMSLGQSTLEVIRTKLIVTGTHDNSKFEYLKGM